jgi:hypothetical protein
MRTSHGSGADPIDIVPLTIVAQDFPARPSALPAVRDFVRRRLADTPLSDNDVRTLCDRLAEVLLDAAGGSGSIQVSLRIFPQYAEVDVLFAEVGDEPRAAVRASPRREPRDPGHVPAVAPLPARPAPAAVNGAATAATTAAAPDTRVLAPPTFAKWLSAALRREGLTMEAAARRLDVSAKTISRWVAGTTEPRLRDLARIRDEFGDPPFG